MKASRNGNVKIRLAEKTYWGPAELLPPNEQIEDFVFFRDFSRLGDVLQGLHAQIYGNETEWFARICREIQVDSIYTHRLLEDVSVESDEDIQSRSVASALYTIYSHFYSAFGEELWEETPDESMLFLKLINDRFLFKSASAPKECETDYYKVVIRTRDRTEVPFSALSSGEQNLLYMYFRLIFWHGPWGLGRDIPSLVIVDEPELSMNVVWQRNFLKDLQRIIELRGFDVLIATHSPEVIYDKWDWTVALGEKGK